MSRIAPQTPAPTAAADLARLARAAIECQDYEGALRYLGALEALAPGAGNRQTIAFCHFQLGHPHSAREWYRKALDLEPGSTGALNNLARISAILGEMDVRDEGVLDAETWNRMAQAQYDLGNFGLARKLFELALENHPGNLSGYNLLSDLILDVEIDRWIARLEKQPPEHSREYSHKLHFLLARLYDRKGDYGRAIDLYRRANDLKYRQAPRAYDEAQRDALVDSIIAYFTAERIAALRKRPAASTLSTQAIVFIVGVPRSGSTLVSRILSADPTVVELGEAHYLADSLGALGQRLKEPFPQALHRLDLPEIMEPLAAGGWQQLQRDYFARIGPRSGLFVDKSLENYLYLGLIVALFPGARLVHTVRDRNDTLISCYKQAFESMPWCYNIGQMKHYYQAYQRLMEHWHAVLPPGALLDMVYERLVEAPESEIPRLAAHCGLSPNLTERPFHEQRGVVKTASGQQVRKPIYKSSVGSFERYRPYISFD